MFRAYKDTIASNQFKMFDHPPNLPDLAPSDFWLFPQFKFKLAGQCHKSQDNLESVIEDIF